MKFVCLLIICEILISGCKKDEELMSGEISGIIAAFNQDYIYSSGQGDIRVNLFKESELIDNTLTNAYGFFVFENIPYGKYHVECESEKYVMTWSPPHVVFHVGGYSATEVSLNLFEVPDYALSLDSVQYTADFSSFRVYLKFNGDTLLTDNDYGYSVIGFVSNSPEVSNSNYIGRFRGYLANWDPVTYPGTSRAYALIYYFEPNMDQLTAGTNYIRIYPLAGGQGFEIDAHYPNALGPPSDVLAFEINP